MADKALEAALLAAGPSHLPKAYGGCTCSCHRTPGIMHMTACCRPAEGEADFAITKEWFERKATLEDGCDVSVGTLSALPGEAEVVERIEAILEAYDADVADAWNNESGERPDLWTPEVDAPVDLLRETLASLQAMQARAEKADRERDEARLDRITAERAAQNMANQLVAADARVKEMEEALNLIDALDPEEHVYGTSHDACRGLVIRMGQIARQALEAHHEQ